MSKGLGRIPHFDPRSMQFRMKDYLRPKLEGEALPTDKVWEHGVIMDQGNTSQCVGHAWQAWENCKPKGFKRQQGHEEAAAWYEESKLHDPWPGTNYEGTATAAGAKVAVLRGLAKAWVNAATVEDIEAFVLTEGACVMGTTWFRSLDNMTANYFLNVDLKSGSRGGHAYLCYGVKDAGATFVFQNSWSESWGDHGSFYLTRDSLKALLYRNGEGIACVQTGLPPR